MKKNKITKYNTLDEAREAIEYLTEKKQKIENQIKINQILKDNNTRTLDDIDSMTPSTDKALLTYNGNEPNTSYDSCIPVMLPKAPTKIVEIKHKNINQGELFKIAVLEDTNIDELVRFNITKPTEEDLSHIRYNASLHIDYKYINSISEDLRLVEIQRLRKEQADKITHAEALNIYYQNELLYFNEETKKEYLRNLSEQEVHEHYKKNIGKLNEDLKKINNSLINNEAQPSSGLATPNDLRIATMGTKQDLKWRDIENKHQDKVRELLKSTAPEILDRLEDDENPNEIISQFIGIKLNKNELRILKTLRAIVDRSFKLGMIQDYTHKTKIYTNDFYQEYGFTARSQIGGYGYDNNQTQPLRKILFGGSNLTKRIFFNDSKNQRVMVTAFILKLEWEPSNNYFEVMLDDIIFVKDKSDKYSYYYENLKGFNRLMELMPNSNSAFELHEYLEYSIKTTNHEFGLTKLLNASPTLTKRYKKDRNETIQRLEKILDEIINAKTLITAWKKVDGKNETKYILTNINKEGKSKLKLVGKP